MNLILAMKTLFDLKKKKKPWSLLTFVCLESVRRELWAKSDPLSSPTDFRLDWGKTAQVQLLDLRQELYDVPTHLPSLLNRELK